MQTKSILLTIGLLALAGATGERAAVRTPHRHLLTLIAPGT